MECRSSIAEIILPLPWVSAPRIQVQQALTELANRIADLTLSAQRAFAELHAELDALKNKEDDK